MKVSECIPQLEFNLNYYASLGNKHTAIFENKIEKFEPYRELLMAFETMLNILMVIGMVYQIFMISKGFYVHNIGLYVNLIVLFFDHIITFVSARDLIKGKKFYKQSGRAASLLNKLKKEEDRDLTKEELKEFLKCIGAK